jgi:hypothetical protein
MAKKKIHVFDRAGEFVVEPAMTEITNATDIVRLVNNTTEDLVWKVDDPIPFGAIILEVVQAGKMSGAKNAVAGVNSRSDFQVLMVKSGKKARGNSDPTIIIDT